MDLTELMDRFVGDRGRAVRVGHDDLSLAAGMGIGAASLEYLLACAMWYEIVDSGQFRFYLLTSGASTRVLDDVRTVVVPHADGTRFDLVVFDPGRGSFEDPLVVPVPSQNRIGPTLAWAVGPGWAKSGSARTRVVNHLARLVTGWHGDAKAAVDTAIQEFAYSRPFAAVVVGDPEFEPTSSVTVNCPNGDMGTVGVAALAGRDRTVLTTAGHVVDGAKSVDVNGHSVAVVEINTVLDVAVLSDPGRLHTVVPSCLCGLTNVPGYNAPARFDGGKSGPKETVVTGTDPAIAAGLRHTAVRLYTPPVTAGGDSGAALLDSSERLLGFCSERTGLKADIGMSTWVWAHQVFDVMNLRL